MQSEWPPRTAVRARCRLHLKFGIPLRAAQRAPGRNADVSPARSVFIVDTKSVSRSRNVEHRVLAHVESRKRRQAFQRRAAMADAVALRRIGFGLTMVSAVVALFAVTAVMTSGLP
jgi:hypothetical protein